MEKLEHILKIDNKAILKSFKKKELVQRKDDVKAKAFYVKKGLLRSYIIDSKGKEHIYVFAPEGWVIGNLESLSFHEPTELFIDCLEDSEIIIFNKDCLFNNDLLKDKILENAQFLYRRIGKLQRRVLMLMGSPAIDRYQYFINTYPDLLNRIPQHMIASYLGIAPQTLSSLRAKMADLDKEN